MVSSESDRSDLPLATGQKCTPILDTGLDLELFVLRLGLAMFGLNNNTTKPAKVTSHTANYGGGVGIAPIRLLGHAPVPPPRSLRLRDSGRV